MSDSETQQETPTSEPPSEALGARVGHGMAWMMVAAIANKLLTSIAQIVLGWKLDPEDFSVYAVATGVAGFVAVCKEAGMRELLVQRGRERFDDLAGPAFWLAFWYNMAVAGLIGLIAYPLSLHLNKPEFALVVFVLGVALPIGTAGGILGSKFRNDLHFSLSSKIAVGMNLSRQSSSIAMAVAGWGALALALPAVISSLYESIAATRASKIALWKRPARTQEWPGLLRESRWLMFASLSNFAVDWGPFVVLMPLGLLTATENGQFYFGYSITAQVGVLLGVSVLLVLTPALTRMAHDPARLRQAVLRSMRTLMLVASIASLGLSACMPALESVLWRGKWEASVWATVILGIFFPWRITFGLTAAILLAQGRFKLYSWLTLFEGAGLTLSCCIAAWIEGSATSVAIGAGLWLFVTRAAICMWVCKQLQLPRRRLGIAMGSSWIIAIIAGGAGWAADHHLPIRATVVPLIPVGSDTVKQMLADVVRVGVAGTITSVLFLGLARVFLHEALKDVVQVAPMKLRRIMGIVCGVRANEQSESAA